MYPLTSTAGLHSVTSHEEERYWVLYLLEWIDYISCEIYWQQRITLNVDVIVMYGFEEIYCSYL